MDRLIDAKLLKSDCNITGGFSDNFVVMDLETLGREIDRQPTVDAVEVVRCKECRFSDCTQSFHENKTYCTLSCLLMDNNEYCSSGAKMDGGEKE